ncbi:MAG: plasmid pRiA4b ORF-3 family protein [Treponema sp.]|nr:plasmid pRiA4b ORF-3 family protein [Treponema sp.]MCL2272513.1 plasmid pRiA4b ORF-3 family protein [Treponema sp.]
MDLEQEESLYEFLENAKDPFEIDDIVAYLQGSSAKRGAGKRDKRLLYEVNAYLDTRKIAFKIDNRHWVSRRGCFEPGEFIITPTRLELLNGILIPGHRGIPFANPLIMPNRYQFFWKGKLVPFTTTEASPEDLYPYYCIYGEEFAPQYIARENPKNEEAFCKDPYEDPPEVSITTLDMRTIYRESSFIPGDRFVVRAIDWKDCRFKLEKCGKDEWQQARLDEWLNAAESGFEDSFTLLGPGASTEEQIAFAYWFGGKRMREIPAYSLEEFLYEKTNRIETVPYGIETRFWFAGKDIPDSQALQNYTVPPDRTFIEDLLYKKNIPISEFVILSYIRDAFFRNEKEIDEVVNRIIPPVIHLDETEWDIITDYISDTMVDFIKGYSLFLDKGAGPVRQRVAELHTAVIDLSARLQKGEIDTTWLPRHTFIVLSQIQGHAAALLEDLAFDESPSENEIAAMDNSLDSMIDTYSEIKELINNSMDNFRKSNLTVIHGGRNSGQLWRMIQISISGLDIWRRAIVSHECKMEELHKIIQTAMGWTGSLRFRFYCEKPDGGKEYVHDKVKLGDVDFRGRKELVYEYGLNWNVKIIIMASYEPAKFEETRFIAGEGASPPEKIEGPRHFKKLLDLYETENNKEKQSARQELGQEFTGAFDLDTINRNLRAVIRSGES